MKTPGLSTGYFVRSDWPDADNRGKVHIVLDGKPVCKQKYGPTTVYQYNSMGIREDWVECKNCQKILNLFKKTQKGKDLAVHFVYFFLHDLKKERNLINKRLKRKVPVKEPKQITLEYIYRCRNCQSINSTVQKGVAELLPIKDNLTHSFTDCACCIQAPRQMMYVIGDLIKVVVVSSK